jgi:hypothetical protein
MAIGLRYPTKPGSDACPYGFDFSNILPLGVGITSGTLEIVLNLNPVQPQSDFTQGEVLISGRRVYCPISGGVPGTDYQFRWSIADTLGNMWQRTALLLCAASD